MSRYEFKLPDIGEGVMEGEIVTWLISQGDEVVEDQPMVEVMTDKATVTITSPKTGRVLELAAPAGNVVPVHSVLVVLDVSGSAPSQEAPEAPSGDGDEGGGGHGGGSQRRGGRGRRREWERE